MIEIDGGQHAELEEDKERDRFFARQGYKVLRFWNNEVLNSLDGVLEIIRENCLLHPPLIPSHRWRGNERIR